jgi:hypothetical protein
MPNVHGIDFKAPQAELVKNLIRELLKDGECAIYALHNIQPNGELRMALTPPLPGPNRDAGVFLRIRPGINAPTIIRPANTKAGDIFMKLEKHTQADALAIIRFWRKQTVPDAVQPCSSRPAGNITRPVPAESLSRYLQRAS